MSVLAAVNPLDAGSLLATFGTVGIAAVLFAETGLLVGFFLPGDSLLFTAGLLCTVHGADRLSLPWVLLASAIGALVGAQCGFLLGRRGGAALLARTRNDHLLRGAVRAEEILARYGHGKAIVLARFVPVIRTVLNPLAGAVGVPARTFAIWQIAGGLIWTTGLVVAGYLLGSTVPNIDHYLLPAIAVIVALSLLPFASKALRLRRQTSSDQ
ncbi:DedA family protein [Actinomadura rugatobispora]|uniref:DedA family protein n=1 Tax=Actinomadura rugatobispora TaxID=1994 RepID=A0ABW1A1F1_9ACTN|nr:DedA family protein [Actinomadura rugatobispora]